MKDGTSKALLVFACGSLYTGCLIGILEAPACLKIACIGLAALLTIVLYAGKTATR